MTEIKPGFYRMSNLEYHRGPGLSSSTLIRLYSYSPLHSQVPVKETPAMMFGSMLHEALEDPEDFENRYVILPDDCRPGSGAGIKTRKEEFEAQVAANNQEIIKQDDYDTIKAMTAAVYSHPECLELMAGDCVTEHSGYAIDPDTGLLIKCRIDLLNKSKAILTDYKSCVDARPGPFLKKSWYLGYWFRACFYLYVVSLVTGLDHRDFRFVAIEREEPYGIQVYGVSPELIKYGNEQVRTSIDKYAECVELNIWPSYQDDTHEFNLPNWLKKQLEYNTSF
ncbi:MAG: PD-(D/E)XK nuclease-like domain-containing protein [Pseudomonadota bacterium]|uniref:Putative exodeoxyribonuclease 8 PDDEXK-like domain-containing protein n=1 Tax=viral metagenome TaxID=1070528 RepID=A0A6M3IX22_9ZZZZ